MSWVKISSAFFPLSTHLFSKPFPISPRNPPFKNSQIFFEKTTNSIYNSDKYHNDRATDVQLSIASFSMALLFPPSLASIESAKFPPMGRSAKSSVLETQGMYSGGYRGATNAVGRLCYCSCSSVTNRLEVTADTMNFSITRMASRSPSWIQPVDPKSCYLNNKYDG